MVWKLVQPVVKAGMVCILLASAGCDGQPLTPEASRLLEAAITAYDQKLDAEAISKLDVFLADYSRMQRADEAYYYRGLAEYNLNRHDAAREDYQRAIDRTDREDLRGRALIGLGGIAYDEGDMAQAERMLMQSLDSLQRGQPPRDHALYRLGMVLQRQSRWEQADRYFNQLIGDFAGTELADRAGERVNARHWTVQAGVFESADESRNLSASLQREDLPAGLWRRMIEGKLLVYVQVGLYRTYEQAEQVLPAVRQICPESFITVTH